MWFVSHFVASQAVLSAVWRSLVLHAAFNCLVSFLLADMHAKPVVDRSSVWEEDGSPDSASRVPNIGDIDMSTVNRVLYQVACPPPLLLPTAVPTNPWLLQLCYHCWGRDTAGVPVKIIMNRSLRIVSARGLDTTAEPTLLCGSFFFSSCQSLCNPTAWCTTLISISSEPKEHGRVRLTGKTKKTVLVGRHLAAAYITKKRASIGGTLVDVAHHLRWSAFPCLLMSHVLPPIAAFAVRSPRERDHHGVASLGDEGIGAGYRRLRKGAARASS